MKKYYYYNFKNKKIYQKHKYIQGDITDIWGNVTGIRGDVTDIRGDVTDIRGDVGKEILKLYIWEYPIIIIKQINKLIIGCREFKLNELPKFKQVKEKINYKNYIKIKSIINKLIKN